MRIYSDDIIYVARKLAVRAMFNFEQSNPDMFSELPYEALVGARNAIINRAFQPKYVIKIVTRLRNRGNEIVEGKNPVERRSAKNIRERFLRGVQFTIEQACLQ